MGIFVYSPSIRMLIEASSTNTPSMSQGYHRWTGAEDGLHTMSIGCSISVSTIEAFSPNDPS
jgi:hypothetical protein